MSNTVKLTVYDNLTRDDKESILISLCMAPGLASQISSKGPGDWIAAVDKLGGWQRTDIWRPYPSSARLLGIPLVKRVGSLSPAEREVLAKTIASDWETVAADFGAKRIDVTNHMYPGFTNLDAARRVVQLACDRNVACAWMSTSVETRIGVSNLPFLTQFESCSHGAEPVPAPTQLVSGPSSSLSSYAMAIDAKAPAKTMRQIIAVKGHATIAKLITALDANDAWLEVLSVKQSDANIGASFAAMKAELVQKKAADDEYNAPFNLLCALCETDMFGAMSVGEFVKTLFGPVPSLQKTAAKIISGLEQSERKKANAAQSATAALIDWSELITSNNLKLEDNVSFQSVMEKLSKLGVVSYGDVAHASVKDLVGCGFKKVSAAKLKTLVAPQPPVVRDSDDDDDE